MAAPSEFDYVIVGAGSAGCVLAARLSANPAVRVLLLEAGGWDWHPLIRIPLGVGRIWGFSRFDWGYETEPEPHIGGRRILLPRRRPDPDVHEPGTVLKGGGHRPKYEAQLLPIKN